MSNLENVAKMLNGREYRNELTKDEEKQLKDECIIVIFGASDDLVELRGFTEDEIGAYNGVNLYFDEEGGLLNSMYEEDYLKEVCSDKNMGFKEIEVIADYENRPTFKYKTDIPHEKFEIWEDDEIYCEGICFYFKDLVS